MNGYIGAISCHKYNALAHGSQNNVMPSIRVLL